MISQHSVKVCSLYFDLRIDWFSWGKFFRPLTDRQTISSAHRRPPVCLPWKANRTIGGSEVKRLSGVSPSIWAGAINSNTRRQFEIRLGGKWYLPRTLNCPRGLNGCWEVIIYRWTEKSDLIVLKSERSLVRNVTNSCNHGQEIEFYRFFLTEVQDLIGNRSFQFPVTLKRSYTELRGVTRVKRHGPVAGRPVRAPTPEVTRSPRIVLCAGLRSVSPPKL